MFLINSVEYDYYYYYYYYYYIHYYYYYCYYYYYIFVLMLLLVLLLILLLLLLLLYYYYYWYVIRGKKLEEKVKEQSESTMSDIVKSRKSHKHHVDELRKVLDRRHSDLEDRIWDVEANHHIHRARIEATERDVLRLEGRSDDSEEESDEEDEDHGWAEEGIVSNFFCSESPLSQTGAESFVSTCVFCDLSFMHIVIASSQVWTWRRRWKWKWKCYV